MKLGFVGTGTIATAVVQAIAKDGHEITVSRRGTRFSTRLAEAFSNVGVDENQAVVDQSEVVFLGLTDDVAAQVLGALSFRPGQQVVTFMAGLSLEAVGEMVAPARAAALMLPFPGIAEGESPIPALGDVGLVEHLFGQRNSVFALRTREELQAYLCAQAVLSPIARMLDESAAWLGARIENASQGEAFLRTLISSSLGGRLTASELIEALNTPGGYNQRLRLSMEEAGMGAALREGLDELAG